MTLTLGASTLAAAPASAQTDNATETAAIVDGVGGVGTGETLTATVDGFTTTAPGSSVTIPGDASGDIEIDSDLGGVAIGIPGDTHHSGVLVGDDDVVYDNVLTDTNIVAQATEDGAQILLTLESSAAPASF
ncbi:MAG: hypothetical protein GY701_00335, partial [Sulfitobacter sp.]|nr:hypothetical protein [Sulfitobacter sp.]